MFCLRRHKTAFVLLLRVLHPPRSCPAAVCWPHHAAEGSVLLRNPPRPCIATQPAANPTWSCQKQPAPTYLCRLLHCLQSPLLSPVPALRSDKALPLPRAKRSKPAARLQENGIRQKLTLLLFFICGDAAAPGPVRPCRGIWGLSQCPRGVACREPCPLFSPLAGLVLKHKVPLRVLGMGDS